MESTGVDRRIQVSHFVYEKARHNPEFRFIERGDVFCKGIGNVRTYFLVKQQKQVRYFFFLKKDTGGSFEVKNVFKQQFFFIYFAFVIFFRILF